MKLVPGAHNSMIVLASILTDDFGDEVQTIFDAQTFGPDVWETFCKRHMNTVVVPYDACANQENFVRPDWSL